jgi:hypothetical protein
MSFLARDIAALRASYLLGISTTDDIYEFAIRNLREPVDDNLLAIAICDKSDKECIEGAAELLFGKLGFGRISLEDALRTLATEVSLQIIDKSLPVRKGAELIVRAVRCADIQDFHELDPFIYAVSEMEERPEDRIFFENALIEEANRWAAMEVERH